MVNVASAIRDCATARCTAAKCSPGERRRPGRSATERGERLDNDPSGSRYGCFLPDLTGLAGRLPAPTSRDAHIRAPERGHQGPRRHASRGRQRGVGGMDFAGAATDTAAARRKDRMPPDFDLESAARAAGLRRRRGRARALGRAGGGGGGDPRPRLHPGRPRRQQAACPARAARRCSTRCWAAPGSGSGVASVDEIDRVNILQASFLAMRRALAALRRGRRRWRWSTAIWSRPTSAARRRRSSAATRWRCRSPPPRSSPRSPATGCMVALAQQFPGYGWETNMGYGVAAHAAGAVAAGRHPTSSAQLPAHPQDVV